MKTPDPQHERGSHSDLRIEEATFSSQEQAANGKPVRTYYVRRAWYGDLSRWHYKVVMDVVPERAAEDILGRTALDIESALSLWDDIWETRFPKPSPRSGSL